MNEPSAREERSKEEILASIRKVVSEQAGAAEPVAAGDEAEDIGGILDLTQEIKEDGSVVDIETGATVATPGDEPQEDRPPAGGLVGAEAEDVSAAAFQALSEAAAGREVSPGPGDKTLEAVAREAMLPIIKDWLDANLPRIVERLVQREIERLSRRGEASAGR